MKYDKIQYQERCILKHNVRNFVGLLTVATLVCGTFSAGAVQTPNPRGASNGTNVRTTTNSDSHKTQRSSSGVVSRATTVRGNSAVLPGRVSARGAIVSTASRGATTVARKATDSATVARTAARAAAAMPSTTTVARTATNNGSRASISRATAVFNDVTKIGGGYATCRDAYATCMDQFCANANDKYRRCFCSSKFTEFKNTESALDQAKTLLMQFEDNNLNAVDKTAAEVNAMYSATVGEAAIKKDTSGAAQILDQIGDLLSGKSTTKNNSGSLGIMNLDFSISSDVDDIWGDNSSGSIFGSNSSKSLSELEGVDLYNASNKQCVEIIASACDSDAVFQMARSAYNIMITQDCNAYEKNIESQREKVKQTVRTAEKYLREARLEEYRNHNSADVNECIGKVKTAILNENACGANYKRCLDFTGKYIDRLTGEPLYKPYLFKLTETITLDGVSTDVLGQNPNFNKELDSMRKYAASALDTCRDKADEVWTEFKRGALIEIAQAQDEKIEEVKMSCVGTMTECYDNIGAQLKDFDDTTAKAAGAASAYAARAMCVEKVSACAALYGNGESCSFDGDGKLKNASACGLTALTRFVDTVDTGRIAESCDAAVDKYLTELCTPTSGTYKYPYNCRTMEFGTADDFTKPYKNGNTSTDKAEGATPKDTIYALLGRFVEQNCSLKATGDSILVNANTQIISKANTAIQNIKSDLGTMLSGICTGTYNGVWVKNNSQSVSDAQNISHSEDVYNTEFYTAVYGGKERNTDSVPGPVGVFV